MTSPEQRHWHRFGVLIVNFNFCFMERLSSTHEMFSFPDFKEILLMCCNVYNETTDFENLKVVDSPKKQKSKCLEKETLGTNELRHTNGLIIF